MRILYDGYIFGQRAGGISRYCGRLIEQLPAECEVVLTLKHRFSLNLPRRPGLKQWYYPAHKLRPWRLAKWSEHYVFELGSRVSKPDVFHPTYYHLLRGSVGDLRCPVVVTVHDMIHELLSTPGAARESSDAVAKAACLKMASFVICVSENTKVDLLRFYDLSEEKVAVIPLASSLQAPADTPPWPRERPYFLYVGRREGYKNFAVLQDAFLRISLGNPEARLIIVGPPLADAEKAALSGPLASGTVECHSGISDSTLARLYAECAAFVYPSHYEGFGIPLLEAMTCGAPILAARAGSIPEVAGNAALYFDPASSDELARALERLLGSGSARADLIANGRTRATMFSWEKTAQETYKVYQRLV